MEVRELYDVCHQTLRDLASDQGLYASARQEAYGCVFGRDSAITVLKLLRVVEKQPDANMVLTCRNALTALAKLQGTATNVESGEEPGKIIHEYRVDNYQRLINRPKPWYVYPDSTLRNYDSVDATPLFLIALHQYYTLTQDQDFLMRHLAAIEAGLRWIMQYGDQDGDFLIEYTLPVERTHGGLTVQSWTDSADSLADAQGLFPQYPIAAVEVQAIAWMALRTWGNFYAAHSPTFSQELIYFAEQLKTAFNRRFLLKTGEQWYLAQALDGYKKQIPTVTANALLCLWASIKTPDQLESIVAPDVVPHLVARAFAPDMFEADAGLRTMSTYSATFVPESYHNGSFWPMLNGLAFEGLQKWQYYEEADKLKKATLTSLSYFGTPIELFIKTRDGKFAEYQSATGKKGCRYQAWTAAAALEMLVQ